MQTRIKLSTPVSELRTLGPRYLERLKRLNLKTLADLLFYFPFRYDDFSKITPIVLVKPHEMTVIRGHIQSVSQRRTPRRHMSLTEVLVGDPTGSLKVIWFNQPFLAPQLKKELEVCMAGKTTLGMKGELVLSNPQFEIVRQGGALTHTGRIVPVYPETEGITSRYLRFLIKQARSAIKDVIEFLPKSTLDNHNLLLRAGAIESIHFPETLLDAKEARRRFAFEELLMIQLRLAARKNERAARRALAIEPDLEAIKKFIARLPFKLTSAQRRAAWDILTDLTKPIPMQRLLEGDVGSGKTMVALIAALAVKQAGHQTAVLVPTEVLARQHFQEFTGRVKKQASVGLLIGETQNKLGLLKKISEDKLDIVIGTHALLYQPLKWASLALVIVDEQHRFGVEQRAQLLKAPLLQTADAHRHEPHLLSMSATPIPRTLALALYGDLEISQLDELPAGRKKVETSIVTDAAREEFHKFIAKRVASGEQVFWICPLIEESEILEVQSATEVFERLTEVVFPKLRIALLHGRMKPKEKDRVMTAFKNREYDILVSTAVIEVGVDVPNATVCVIEGADRFGLAQLHQFRGRVGRSEKQAWCFLISDAVGAASSRRLRALIKTNSGFELAEKDLAIRGPGDFIGARQAGMPDLTMASLKDLDLVKEAREESARILSEDPELAESPVLNRAIQSFIKKIHLE